MAPPPSATILAVGVLAIGMALPLRAQDTPQYQNLEVLPPTITQDELAEVMLANLRGLGLPRLEGRGCLYCHVGDLDTPRGEWDYASDAKPEKRKARVMMAMVRAINERHLPVLESRIDSTLTVTCATCHAGRTDPRPLPTLLWSAYDAGGIDSVETRYRALRDRYYGGDAYDFRTGVLRGLAARMADTGAFDDAIRVAAIEVDVSPDNPRAHRDWAHFQLVRAIHTDGVEAAIERLRVLEGNLPPDALTPNLLDALGWGLFRQDRQAEAVTLFRHNLERFPNEYVPNETMAFALWDTGEEEAALAVLERWLERHPDHDRARRLLVNLRGG